MKTIFAVLIVAVVTGVSVAHELPNAIDELTTIQSLLKDQPILFLDYDGTLSNIVDNPDLAFMTSEMRVALDSASRKFRTAIVTGRSIKTIWKFVPADLLYFAGGHGYDIYRPSKIKLKEIGEEYVETLVLVEHLLEERLRDSGIKGYEIENNRHSVSVHYRHVELDSDDVVLSIVKEIIAQFQESLRLAPGAKVWEIRPKNDWHKGFAINYFLTSIFNSSSSVPIYLGDDKSDEDAFIEVNKHDGVSILVTSTAFSHGVTSSETNAKFTLSSPTEVQEFLEKLAA